MNSGEYGCTYVGVHKCTRLTVFTDSIFVLSKATDLRHPPSMSPGGSLLIASAATYSSYIKACSGSGRVCTSFSRGRHPHAHSGTGMCAGMLTIASRIARVKIRWLASSPPAHMPAVNGALECTFLCVCKHVHDNTCIRCARHEDALATPLPKFVVCTSLGSK
jgi:hypothetical protein